MLAWGLTTWYCARLLLTRRFPLTDQRFFDRTRQLRIWLPRVGGSLVAFVVAGGFWRVASWDEGGFLAYGLILLFAVASWILFGSMVTTYWPLASGYPTLTLPLILAALVMSWWNDNHTVRSTEARIAAAPRETPQEHFRGWLETRLERAPAGQPYPVFVVAAAGGGIRVAYWTASVLGRLAEETALNLVRGFHGGTESVQSPRCRDGCVFEFSLGGGTIEPPLGWSLSARGRKEMDEHLDRQRIKFECIRGLLTGAGCAKEPPCPARRQQCQRRKQHQTEPPRRHARQAA